MEESPIIVALDGMSKKKALELAETLSGFVWGFKVNHLIIHCGVEIIRELKQYGLVFADLKHNDTPATVVHEAAELSAAGADIITVHASGGIPMMRAAVREARKSAVYAVTLLTSLNEMMSIYIYSASINAVVYRLALFAQEAGVHGIVCSPQELAMLNTHQEFDHLKRIVAGIRPLYYVQEDDQERTGTPGEAVENGADFLVIGRPITKASDPFEAVKEITEEIEQVKGEIDARTENNS